MSYESETPAALAGADRGSRNALGELPNCIVRSGHKQPHLDRDLRLWVGIACRSEAGSVAWVDLGVVNTANGVARDQIESFVSTVREVGVIIVNDARMLAGNVADSFIVSLDDGEGRYER
jgi:hypothetical protein